MDTIFNCSKRIIEKFHKLIAHSPYLSTFYVAIWGRLLRVLPDGVVKKHIVNALSSTIPWPISPGPKLLTRLHGSSTSIQLLPHPGLMDFRARFESTMDYEPEVVKALDHLLDDVNTVIEIGANVGLFTTFFSNKLRDAGNGGWVFVFEPSTVVFKALMENLCANGSENVSAFNAAISDQTGFVKFFEPIIGAEGYLGLSRSSLSQVHANWGGAGLVKERLVLALDGTALESLLVRGKTLIKIDAEGAEEAILRAIEPILCKHRPDVIIEVLYGHTGSMNDLQLLVNEYALFLLTDQGPVRHQAFIGDPNYQFRDYLLIPNERADAVQAQIKPAPPSA